MGVALLHPNKNKFALLITVCLLNYKTTRCYLGHHLLHISPPMTAPSSLVLLEVPRASLGSTLAARAVSTTSATALEESAANTARPTRPREAVRTATSETGAAKVETTKNRTETVLRPATAIQAAPTVGGADTKEQAFTAKTSPAIATAGLDLAGRRG